DVAPHRANGARDHTDAARRGRQASLALHREESLGAEPALERLVAQIRVARARGTKVVDHELASAVAGIQLHIPVRDPLRTVAPVAVSPLRPRSVSVTLRTTDAGSSTPIGEPSYSESRTVIPSVR